MYTHTLAYNYTLYHVCRMLIKSLSLLVWMLGLITHMSTWSHDSKPLGIQVKVTLHYILLHACRTLSENKYVSWLKFNLLRAPGQEILLPLWCWWDCVFSSISLVSKGHITTSWIGQSGQAIRGATWGMILTLLLLHCLLLITNSSIINTSSCFIHII